MAENDPVELVDDDGRGIGVSTVAEAHRAPGLRHRAFSVILHDGAGRVLLQQRAAAKTRFGGAWANTCCGHPAQGVDPADAAVRRTVEELGAQLTGLVPAGIYVYDAPDEGSGMVECEYDHVLLAESAPDLPLDLDPAEVAQVAWVDLASVLADPGVLPGDPAPWLLGVLSVAARHLGITSPG